MSTTSPKEPFSGGASEQFDYELAEGLRTARSEQRRWRDWVMVAIGLAALLAVLSIVVSVAALSEGPSSGTGVRGIAPAAPATATAATVATSAAPTLADARGISFERFRAVDPTLPAVPAGAVKKFAVSVLQHVVQVSPELAPVQAWTYTVNGVGYRGTAASPPMVVNQGDRVQITFVNGVGRDSGVDMAHSIDVHAAQLAPNLNYVDVAPGHKKVITFTARYAGVFMYHCATQPVLMHTGAGMTGMLVVKPRSLAPAAKELWLTQGEYYIGKPGGLADIAKMSAEKPDVIAFNGYANQYKIAPIDVPAHQTVRIFVLNAGPSKWSAFHVIGTLFDSATVEGVLSHGAQTINLAPSQGAWVDLTLEQPGNYSFVTHSFGDMTKGAAGVLHTPGAPAPAARPVTPTGGSTQPVLPATTSSMPAMVMPSGAAAPAGAITATMGEMWLRSSTSVARAGKVTFSVGNSGQMPHQFAIMRAPVTLKNGLLDPAGVLAQSKQLEPGQAQVVTARLTAGRYELVCLMPGHYSAGQHSAFTVSG